jgi:hypothetical protein
MSWCEGNGVEYVLGLARNQRLRRIIGGEMWEAAEQWKASGPTKEIESTISGEFWDRQKRWEMKREVLFSAVTRMRRQSPLNIKGYAAAGLRRTAQI